MKSACTGFILILCLFVFQHIQSQGIQDPNLQAAYQAQSALNLEETRTLFNKVATNLQATKKDRCDALRALAVLYWKHDKNYQKAQEYLVLADSVGDYRSETWLTKLRIEAEAQNFDKAIEAGKKAIDMAASVADKNYGKYKYTQVILDQAMAQLETQEAINEALLNSAKTILEDVLKTNPTNVNAADILLGISLIQNNAKSALEAWLAYYRFSNTEAAYDYLKPAAMQLETVLNAWQDRTLTPAEQVSLVEALIATRFYKYGKLVATQFDLKNAKAILYANYTQAIESLTNEYYRQVSIGAADSEQFLEDLRAKNEALYAQLTTTNDFNSVNFRRVIRERFGGYYLISSSSASRQVGLVFGHVVNERDRNIEQYGHRANFSFTELDMMVSNGYPSWFWEIGGAGGYALRGGFLRIKPLFKYLPITAWERVTDSVKRKKIEKEIQTNLINSDVNTDLRVIRSAVSKKINLDALDTLYGNLFNQGYTGLDLQLKFIEQYELYRDNGTMFAHEGRHSIDRVVLGQDAYRALGSKRIEYRGRLSQITFSDAPKLELADMLVGVSSTPTGQSNQMILDVFEAWITAHSDTINGYNANQLPIANLYKLTNAQIISCIQAVDPFYLEYKKIKH